MRYFSVFLGLATANFGYQFFQDIPKYDFALSSSFFQGGAIIAVAISFWLDKKPEDDQCTK